MIPSVYVVMKSNKMVFCVSKEHYELYKDKYELVDLGKQEDPIPESPVVEAPKPQFDISETLTVKKSGRPKKEK